MISESSKRQLALSIGFAAVIACCGTILLGQEKNAPDDARALFAAVMKDKLDPELAKLRINENKSGRETKVLKNPVKDIVIHTDWEVSINAACDDPQKNSQFVVEQLAKDDAGAYTLTLIVTAPMSGEAWGEIKTVAKTKVDFHADVRLRVKGSLAKTGEDWTAKVIDGDIVIDKLSLKPQLADLLSNALKDLGNGALVAEKTNLKEKANTALEKAANEGRLKAKL
jgi:hypothetical protein